MRQRKWAYLGGTLGFLGWVIGFTIVCLISGDTHVLPKIAVPGTILSLGMAGILVVSLELTIRTFGQGRFFFLVLWGELTFSLGVLSLFLNTWIAPVVESSPALMTTLQNLHAQFRIPEPMAWGSLVLGVVLIGVAVAMLSRGQADT